MPKRPVLELAAVFAAFATLLSCQMGVQRRLLREYQEYFAVGLHQDAKRPARELLVLAERENDPTLRATALERAANLELMTNQFAVARELYERALQDVDGKPPSNPVLLGKVLVGLAEAHRQSAEREPAEAAARRAITVLEPTGDAYIARAFASLGKLYRDQGRREEAVATLQRAFDLDVEKQGLRHPDVGKDANNLAALFFDQGRYAEAAELFQRAIDIATESRGPDHPEVAGYLGNLGVVYSRQGRYRESEELTERAIASYQRTYGLDAPAALMYRYNLVSNRIALGKYKEAERDFGELIPLLERIRGSSDESTQLAYTNFCEVEMMLGFYDRAEALCRRVVDAASGPDAPARNASEKRYTGGALGLLGGLYSTLGRFADAEQAIKLSLRYMRAIGTNYDGVGFSLANLGKLYLEEGNPEQAIPPLKESIRLSEKMLGSSHEQTAAAYALLGDAENALGHRDRATELYSRAFEVQERVGGAEHGQAGSYLASLARTCRDPCKSGDRLAIALRALEIMRKGYGEERLRTAEGLSLVAELRGERGDRRGAVADLANVAELHERQAGLLSPETKRALRLLAWAKAQADDAGAAVQVFERTEMIEEKQLETFLGSVSESRQRAFLDDARTTLDYLVAFQQRWLPRSEGAQRLVFQAVLRRKARALDVTAAQLETAQSVPPTATNPLSVLRTLRGNLAALLLRGPGALSPELYKERVAELVAQQEQAEAAVAVAGKPLATTPISLDTVGAALPAESALVEIVRYSPPGAPPRYGLYATKHAGHAICSLELGSAALIEHSVAELRAALAAPGGNSATAARKLDRTLFEPLESFLADVKQVYIAPDGFFHLVPFAALVDRRGRFRVQSWQISVLDSGRDLLRTLSPSSKDGVATDRQPALVMGDVVFDRLADRNSIEMARVDEGPTSRNARSRDFGKKKFGRLPATAGEAREVAKALGVLPVLGIAASEERIKGAQSPVVLHLATHAFFLHDLPSAQIGGSRPSREQALPVLREQESSMLRSGLALAGANLQSAEGDDGVLTALEATTLRLAGTELVTLSACDSGVGAIDRGEGVLGLRRAFALAGARSLLMSLWSVSDAATRRFMVDYYGRLARGEGRAAALRAVQREFLADPVLRDPYYWAPFLLAGDPGPIPGLSSERASDARPRTEVVVH